MRNTISIHRRWLLSNLGSDRLPLATTYVR
jgi:hypothetical protein